MSDSFEIKCNVCEGKGSRRFLDVDDNLEWIRTEPIECVVCKGTGKQTVKFKGYKV
jgi:hypothetical protein